MVVDPGRRRVLAGAALSLAVASTWPCKTAASALNQRPIPRTGEQLPVIGVAAFREWYEGVVRIFFDEIHVVERTTVSWKDQRALVKVLVNWQARRWSPPAARSQWIGFDADQDWEMIRSAASGRPLIARYVVNELRPMPGSSPL